MSEEKLSTREKLLQVIEGMEQAGSLMTISGVAKEVGVSNSTIHNRYPNLAERIRSQTGVAREKNVKTQLVRRLGTIKNEKAKRARVLKELEDVKEMLCKANSINAALQFENDSLKAQLDELRCQSLAQVVTLIKMPSRFSD